MVHYAIVGFGNAGYHAARAIRARYPQGEIHILSDQTFPPANPMLTTYYVKGIGRVCFRMAAWRSCPAA